MSRGFAGMSKEKHIAASAAGGKAKTLKGFAVMSKEERQRISSLGGKAVPPEKRAYSRDRKLASRAGRKGGLK